MNLTFTPRKNPWDTRGEKLPPVDLAQVLLESDAYGRPLHRIAETRRALGLPTTNQALERRLQELDLWPTEAQPLPFDIADVLWMLPKNERTVAYGLISGMDVSEIAKQTGIKQGTIYSYVRVIQQRWIRLADFLGVIRVQSLGEVDEPLKVNDVTQALGYPGRTYVMDLVFKLGLWNGGLYRRDFFTVWQNATRRDDLLSWYVSEIKEFVTEETYLLHFASKYSKQAAV